MRKKWIIFLVLLILTILSIFLIVRGKKQAQKEEAYLKLQGSNIIVLEQNVEFKDPGYQAYDPEQGDITNQVKIENTIQMEEPGTYEITYQVTTTSGQKLNQKRFVVVNTNSDLSYKAEYDKIDNKLQGWGVNTKKDLTRPIGNATNEELLKYNAYFMGPDEKVIYLTFDEGSNDTYVKEIMDVLNKNEVKATFFFCKNYILSNPELMKELVQTGHSVGNHTANHKVMPTLATATNFQKYLKEIKAVEDAFYKTTGTQMDKIYREPSGDWSFRSIQIMKDLGYKTYFWSASYPDYKDTVSGETALNELIKRLHNGAIYLIHPKNKGNMEAMDSLIKNIKDLGYRFDLVKNIP